MKIKMCGLTADQENRDPWDIQGTRNVLNRRQ